VSDSNPDVSNDNRYLNFDEVASVRSHKRRIVSGVAVVLTVTVGGVLYRLNNPPIATMKQFMRSLPPYSLQLAQNNSSSPQAKALAWTMNHSQYPLYRLKQRYALAVLYYSTNGESWVDNSRWLSDSYEWYWYPGSAAKNFRSSGLSLANNGLDGSLPTELELLTDLESMAFDDALSGMIHSELCVPCLPASHKSSSLLLT
jgi:hypothetical protein